MMEENEKENLKIVNELIEIEGLVDKKANDYEQIMYIYKSALKVLNTKFEILNEEFNNFYEYNPIDHITQRIKSPESIIDKMKKKELELTYRNLVEYINDVAGMRIICSFKDDVYKIVNIIEDMRDVEIIKRKDYISNPKKSGYSSYHLIVKVPVNISNQLIYVKVEIQIRTVAMDFWASIEHKLKYKKGINAKASKELVSMAKIMNKLDERVMKIRYNT